MEMVLEELGVEMPSTTDLYDEFRAQAQAQAQALTSAQTQIHVEAEAQAQSPQRAAAQLLDATHGQAATQQPISAEGLPSSLGVVASSCDLEAAGDLGCGSASAAAQGSPAVHDVEPGVVQRPARGTSCKVEEAGSSGAENKATQPAIIKHESRKEGSNKAEEGD